MKQVTLTTNPQGRIKAGTIISIYTAVSTTFMVNHKSGVTLLQMQVGITVTITL